ncbi:glycine--tRNA ligase subunit beta [Paracoccus sp. R12_1]|uniref:glycine--tRNA ligase subunit beta n=1 Tax=unclassified Paracoccus (in: a-proteobacteria) TaxID=2688777 RepID=UPI001ADA0CC8|nr:MULTISPECIES: glycine--tRNA ligase subunit beta [unclassified Paracoccus (in: a-proteobacteria)]MBO9454396.1 glycine--tRNA ligase subunit beta [Paracoccus sp. R12_2]MBO9485182.1 glycine--tRNA ligase subunit beta [Paracoccus sp. R12_1]
MPDLLIELFSEEIPARMQARAADDLKRLITDGLVEAGLTYASAGAFSTPRRLTLAVEGLTAGSPTTREERKGPRTDAPEKALEGFLRSTGLSRDQLEARDDKKGQVWFATIEKPGRPAAEIVAKVLDGTIRNFPWPKSMRWGTGALRWVRPLHSILCILSDETGATVVPLTVEGITAGDSTRGHRFMAPDAFTVIGFDDYAARLRRARVMLDPAERREAIRSQADNLAFARGWEIVADDGLLSEVAGLVEWPVPLMGVIEDRFLDLPPEVLQTSMKEHQKFFSARNPKTGRIEGFVTVANIETQDDGATILAGNQRVLAARLSDAAFFWENDLREAKSGMEAWAEGLKSVTFHNKLGSQADRIARIAALSREIAPLVGADPDQAEQAAKLAKLDLRSAMVGEFPELQGIMGRYYALAAGEPEAVADAARDHYSPLGPSDTVPTAPVSVAVALADKIDTLTGFWAIDEKPTGSKDPFALRRAALGVIRLVLGNGVRIEVSGLIAAQLIRNAQVAFGPLGALVAREAARGFGAWLDAKGVKSAVFDEVSVHASSRAEVFDAGFDKYEDREFDDACGAANADHLALVLTEACPDLLAFLHDRLKVHLRDQGIRHDIIDAVLAQPGNDDLVQVVNRATALNDMLATEDGKNLTQGLKRASNILSQAEEKDGVEYSFGADVKFAETDEERALFAALDTAEPAIRKAMAAEDFPAAMAAIAGLCAPIDAFFDAVQVNSDNQILRRNRLNLLSRIRDAGRQIADFGRIQD